METEVRDKQVGDYELQALTCMYVLMSYVVFADQVPSEDGEAQKLSTASSHHSIVS